MTRQGWGWAEGLLEAPAPSQPLGLHAAHPGAESSPAVAVLCRPPHATPGGSRC